MGVMGKFRDNTAVILWILIGSFGLLWVIMDVFDPNAIMGGPRSLGSVNGEPISFEEYNQRVEYYMNAYTQQTGNSMSPETRALYESQVWEELVSSKLLEQKMDELGITVTDDELLSMAYGDNPDPLIRQYFAREDGTIDRFMIQNVLQDEQYSQEAMAIELQLRQKRRQQKLSNFITAGLQVTDEEVQEAYKLRNTFADVQFVRFPYNEVTDSKIEITDNDLRDYYEENKENYKQEESYRAKYVAFSTLPTAEDTAAISNELIKLKEDFAAAEDDSLFLVYEQSTTPYNGVFVAKEDLREEYAPVLDVEVGEVTDVINLGSSVAIIKKVDENRNEIKFAVLSRIIEALPATLNEAGENADTFEYFATEQTSFEEEAERAGLVVQEIFATKGNTFISGLGASQQVLDFLSNGDEGDLSQPIELATQLVVVKLEEVTEAGPRPFEDVKTAIENAVKNEKRTQIVTERVESMLASNSTVASLAEASGKEVQSVEALAASSTVLRGGGREPGVIGAIFGLSEGETSGAIEGVTAVYVVHVVSKTEPDLSTLDQATVTTIRQELEQKENQRYLAVWLEELKDEADIVDNRSKVFR